MSEEPRGNEEILVVLWLSALCVAYEPRKPRPRYLRPSKYRELRWRKILAVMSSERALIGKEIAHLAGLKDDGQVRGDLAELARQGKVRRVKGSWGYVRCDVSGDAAPASDAT